MARLLQVQNKYELTAIIFTRLFKRCPNIRDAMLGEENVHLLETNNVDSIAEVPFVASHIDRFNHFIDQVV